MELNTKVNIPKSSFNITHTDSIMLLGSCFTENIGHFLNNRSFSTCINPFGIIYNPLSIVESLERITQQKIYTLDELVLHHDLYFSLDHHGRFSDTSAEKMLEMLNNSLQEAYNFLERSSVLIITLGTSFIYEYKKRQKVVANCHKLPGNEFEKQLLSIEVIKESFNKIKHKLEHKKIIFTVSPVRHWRDGAIENGRSKSLLIESIHQLIEENENCFYFPAYEIMMDELRDYRFYAEDMLHPNETAVKYIWQRFAETFFNKETMEINRFIEKGNALFAHRIKHSNTKEAIMHEVHKQKFIDEFQQRYPELSFQLNLHV